MTMNQLVRLYIGMWSGVRFVALLLSAVVVLLLIGPRPAFAAEDEVPVPVVDAVDEALMAWAEFATTGDTAGIESVFVVGGPQYRQLMAESSARTDTESPEPLHFIIRELRLRRLGPERSTVWARVEAARLGFESQVLSWDFDLIRRDRRWQVWTVLAADRPEVVPDPRFESSTTSTTSTTAAPPEEPTEPEYSAAQPLDSAAPTSGVRLPALSAWIIVITVIAVALAGYLAPRLDRGREQ